MKASCTFLRKGRKNSTRRKRWSKEIKWYKDEGVVPLFLHRNHNRLDEVLIGVKLSQSQSRETSTVPSPHTHYMPPPPFKTMVSLLRAKETRKACCIMDISYGDHLFKTRDQRCAFADCQASAAHDHVWSFDSLRYTRLSFAFRLVGDGEDIRVGPYRHSSPTPLAYYRCVLFSS